MIFILIVKYLQIVFSYNMKSIVKLNSITLGFFLVLSITTNLIFIMDDKNICRPVALDLARSGSRRKKGMGSFT